MYTALQAAASPLCHLAIADDARGGNLPQGSVSSRNVSGQLIADQQEAGAHDQQVGGIREAEKLAAGPEPVQQQQDDAQS